MEQLPPEMWNYSMKWNEGLIVISWRAKCEGLFKVLPHHPFELTNHLPTKSGGFGVGRNICKNLLIQADRGGEAVKKVRLAGVPSVSSLTRNGSGKEFFGPWGGCGRCKGNEAWRANGYANPRRNRVSCVGTVFENFKIWEKWGKLRNLENYEKLRETRKKRSLWNKKLRVFWKIMERRDLRN